MSIDSKNPDGGSPNLSIVSLGGIYELYGNKSGLDPLVAERGTKEQVTRVLDTDSETVQAPSVLVLAPKAKQLREIAGSFFMGPDELWGIYRKLNITIPPEEIAAVEEIYGKLLLGPDFDKFRAHAQTFKLKSERGMNPIIMGPRPAEFLESSKINGKVWLSENHIDANTRYINQGMNVPHVNLPPPSNFSFPVQRRLEQQYAQSWGYSLSVWTSSVLEGTRGQHYSSQVQLQNNLAKTKGENSFAIGLDAFFPLTHAHILNGFSPIPLGTEIRTNSGYSRHYGSRADFKETFNYAFGLKGNNTLNVYFFDINDYGNGDPESWNRLDKNSGIGAAYHYKFSP